MNSKSSRPVTEAHHSAGTEDSESCVPSDQSDVVEAISSIAYHVWSAFKDLEDLNRSLGSMRSGLLMAVRQLPMDDRRPAKYTPSSNLAEK